MLGNEMHRTDGMLGMFGCQQLLLLERHGWRARRQMKELRLLFRGELRQKTAANRGQHQLRSPPLTSPPIPTTICLLNHYLIAGRRRLAVVAPSQAPMPPPKRAVIAAAFPL